MRRTFLTTQWILMACVALVLTGCETMKEQTKGWDLNPEYDQSMNLRETYENSPKITSTRLKNPEGDGEVVRSKPRQDTSGYYVSSIAYPTGRKDSSSLLITKKVPKVVRKGAAYDYMIEVTNLTDLQLEDVMLKEVLPNGYQLASATPQADKSGNILKWDFDKLKSGETRAVTVTGKTMTSDLPCCTSAEYAPPALCLSTSVVQPSLDVAVEVPPAKVICDTVPAQFTVKNSGDSDLNDVIISSQLPSGLMTTDGESKVMIKAGSLAQGQSRTFSKSLKASKTGSYNLKASAQDNSDVTAESSVDAVKITQPTIAVTVKADRSKQYVGRNVGYTLTARNSGATPTTNTMVTATIPSGTRFVSADMNGSQSGDSVSWNLGTLAAGASKTLNYTVTAGRAGEIQTTVQAKAYCCQDTDLAKANIEGIPALLLEVVDLNDPIEVGGNQIYVITVTNQGSADANNVAIAAELEGMTYVSASGATTGSANGNAVTLKPVVSIAAKQKATWRVTAKTTEAGDRRFKVKMTSAELGRPVEETESTFVY